MFPSMKAQIYKLFSSVDQQEKTSRIISIQEEKKG